MSVRLAAIITCIGLATTAAADPAADAETRWSRGQKLYNLGKFREAILEFEAAYQIDDQPAYLFAIAQAHRLDNNAGRAVFFYRRYLELEQPELVQNREEIEGRIRELESAKSPTASPERRRRVRLAIDVGSTSIYLVGDDDSRQSVQLSGRILLAYMKHVGKYTFDFGASWQVTTLPYRDTSADQAASALYTQLHAIVAASRPIAGPVWARVGVGLGGSVMGNLKPGNPITMGAVSSTDIRMWCARIDTVVGYRYTSTIDFVLGVSSASVASGSDQLDERISRITTLEGFYLGIYIKL